MNYFFTDLINKVKIKHFHILFNENDLNKCAMYENYWM